MLIHCRVSLSLLSEVGKDVLFFYFSLNRISSQEKSVVYPNSWRVCIIKLVHAGMRSAFSRSASLIKWRDILSHLFTAASQR